jgi:hypothetical protein
MCCSASLQVHSMDFLSQLLSTISAPFVFDQQQAASVEACCLEALDWRLGPYFLTEPDEDQGAQT